LAYHLHNTDPSARTRLLPAALVGVLVFFSIRYAIRGASIVVLSGHLGVSYDIAATLYGTAGLGFLAVTESVAALGAGMAAAYVARRRTYLAAAISFLPLAAFWAGGFAELFRMSDAAALRKLSATAISPLLISTLALLAGAWLGAWLHRRYPSYDPPGFVHGWRWYHLLWVVPLVYVPLLVITGSLGFAFAIGYVTLFWYVFQPSTWSHANILLLAVGIWVGSIGIGFAFTAVSFLRMSFQARSGARWWIKTLAAVAALVLLWLLDGLAYGLLDRARDAQAIVGSVPTAIVMLVTIFVTARRLWPALIVLVGRVPRENGAITCPREAVNPIQDDCGIEATSFEITPADTGAMISDQHGAKVFVPLGIAEILRRTSPACSDEALSIADARRILATCNDLSAHDSLDTWLTYLNEMGVIQFHLRYSLRPDPEFIEFLRSLPPGSKLTEIRGIG